MNVLILGGDEVKEFVMIEDVRVALDSLIEKREHQLYKLSKISSVGRMIITGIFVENVGVKNFASRTDLMNSYIHYRLKLSLSINNIELNHFDRQLEELLCGGIIASYNTYSKKPWNSQSSPDQVCIQILKFKNIFLFLLVTIIYFYIRLYSR